MNVSRENIDRLKRSRERKRERGRQRKGYIYIYTHGKKDVVHVTKNT